MGMATIARTRGYCFAGILFKKSPASPFANPIVNDCTRFWTLDVRFLFSRIPAACPVDPDGARTTS